MVSRNLVKKNSNNDHYYYLISLLYYNTGNYEKTVENLKKAISLQPKNIDYKIYLARTFSNNEKKEEAIKLYEQVMKEDPRYEIAWAEKASIYENSGNKEKALRIRRDAARKFPSNSYDQYMLGRICEDLNLKQEAIISYKKALELEPDADIDAADRISKLTGKFFKPNYYSKEERIPLTIAGNLMLIKVKINRMHGTFLVDTGASSSILYERFLTRNKIKLILNGYGVLEFANGKREFAPTTYINLEIGKNFIKDVRVYIITDLKNLNIDGIIGMDILERFNIQIDKNKECIILNKTVYSE